MQHFNYATGNTYQSDRNLAELEAVRLSNNWIHGAWLTFRQAQELGLHIRKGEHGTRVFKGFGTVTDKDTGETKSGPLGFALLFNISQTDAPEDMAAFDIRDTAPINRVAELVAA